MDKPILEDIAHNFTQELTLSEQGKKTSLPFIINQLPNHPLVAEGETFQVIGLGGSIFRSALITKKNNQLEVKTPIERSHPIFDTKEDFLSFISENLSPRISYLAINIAQAVEPFFRDGRLDGKLVGAAKEHRFEGLLGENVCEELEKFVKEDQGRDIKASIANDTICLMLSGLTKYPAENLAAGIVGTGMNFAIFLDATHAVNLEASDFDKFPVGPEAQTIDRHSEVPGFHVWEKETAGAYLHEHFNMQIRDKKIKYPFIKNTQELDSVIRQEIPQVSDIALDVMHTSAKMVGAMMAGIMNFYKKDVTFVMQGSLFWKGYEYKETVAKTLEELAPEYKADFAYVDLADYLGAAKLIA
ncbi:MAG TPA: hypothetical protein VFQ63_01985 [Patescibacteria group bacterium]|nr:hypothetical protein [Patescibacteria group bacterium]